MRNKVVAFLNLSAPDQALLIKALMLIPLVALKIRFMGFKKTRTWLTGVKPSTEASPPRAKEKVTVQAVKTAQVFTKAVRLSLIKGRCLSQSLALWYLLHSQGIASELCIGVQKKDDALPLAVDNFDAHAWVEYQGIVLNDDPRVRERFQAVNLSTQSM